MVSSTNSILDLDIWLKLIFFPGCHCQLGTFPVSFPALLRGRELHLPRSLLELALGWNLTIKDASRTKDAEVESASLLAAVNSCLGI